MTTQIHVPTIENAGAKLSVGRWFKSAGDPVSSGEPLVEINSVNHMKSKHRLPGCSQQFW